MKLRVVWVGRDLRKREEVSSWDDALAKLLHLSRLMVSGEVVAIAVMPEGERRVGILMSREAG